MINLNPLSTKVNVYSQFTKMLKLKKIIIYALMLIVKLKKIQRIVSQNGLKTCFHILKYFRNSIYRHFGYLYNNNDNLLLTII